MSKQNGFVEQTLANGLRVVIEPMPQVQSVAAGFLVRTGARDEPPELAGVSHFLEHMCFKGTAKRTWRDITVDFDNMGSTYNAYTSKERTSFFGWVRVEDLERQLELLADMMRSAIPPDEFEMEKKVVLDEIARSEDSIEHRVYDQIHRTAYGDHSLSWPVLGTDKTVGAMSREQLHAYFASRYQPANLVMVVTGAVDPKAVIGIAERLCGEWPAAAARPERRRPAAIPEGTTVIQTDRFQQQALVLAYPAPSAVDVDRETADVCLSILGGHNSRFFWNIIQEGVAPHVSVGRVDYCDVGMMIAFGFCEPSNSEKVLDAMRREIGTLSSDGPSEDEVQRVKNRARTSLALEAESPYYRYTQVVQDVDVLGRPRTVADRLGAIDAVTVGSIGIYTEAWPMTGVGCLTSLGPRDWPRM